VPRRVAQHTLDQVSLYRLARHALAYGDADANPRPVAVEIPAAGSEAQPAQ
jgi:hypothetical protein